MVLRSNIFAYLGARFQAYTGSRLLASTPWPYFVAGLGNETEIYRETEKYTLA